MELLPPRLPTGKPLYLGRLALKEEAAGKIRVFAITDLITQTVMKPLHNELFRVLKAHPCDGTFDQTKPLDRLVKLWEEGILSGETFYSFDLSAATDRLPIDLQCQILGLLISEEFA